MSDRSMGYIGISICQNYTAIIYNYNKNYNLQVHFYL